MEDQQPDPGDLTTDAETQAVDTPTESSESTPRRKHRMPRRSQLGPTSAEIETEVTDEAPKAAEPSSVAVEVPAQPGTPARRRRWFSLRRSPKTPEPETVSETEEETAPAPRTPVGKSRRAVKPEEPTEAAPKTDDDEPITVAESEAQEESEPEPEVDQVFVPHQPMGKRLTIAAAAAGVLFVGAAGFAGATVQPYLADRAAVDIKLDVARTAANAITTLWTYTPDNLESLPDRSERFLAGDFAFEYRKYIDAIIAPNKQAQVTNTTEVMGAAVESLTSSEATVIVYTNSVATSPATKNIPSLRYLSYRLTLEHRDTKWLITRMSTVTSLDLTPQL